MKICDPVHTRIHTLILMGTILLTFIGCGGGGSVNESNPITISGRVSDVNGSYLQGANVALSGPEASQKSTDKNGIYTFTISKNGTYAITPSKAGYSFNPISKNTTINNASSSGQDFKVGTVEFCIDPSDPSSSLIYPDRYYIGEYSLYNNVWGKGSLTSSNYKQCLLIKEIEGKIEMGYNWTWPNSNTVLAFPEIIYGKSPWVDKSTTSKLPMKAGSKDIYVSFNALINATGEYNLAFDIWITNSIASTSSSRVGEIMIWMVNNGANPAGTKRESVQIDSRSYDLYIKEDHHGSDPTILFTYFAFLSKTNQTEVNDFNINSFVKYLISKGLITSDQYVSSVELGNEIWSGNGTTNFKGYSVRIE